MEKLIKLSESNLEKIIKQVIKESEKDRISTLGTIKNKQNEKLIENGYSPYYLDFKEKGNYKIVKVNKITEDLPRTTYYFLSKNEYEKLKKLVENVNNLTLSLLEEIELRRKQLIGVLEQVIMK